MQRATWMLLAVWGRIVALGAGHDKGTKTPEVMESMKRMNKGNDAVMRVMRKELQEASHNWSDIQKQAKEYNTLAATMEKNNPPMGAKDSWSQLCRGYSGITQELDSAPRRRTKRRPRPRAKLKTTCMTCHKAHRP